MDFGNAGNGTSSGDDNSGDEQYYRHSSYQIQRLEEAFNKCSHPNKIQRLHLGMDLGLEPRQVKFWFQNRRNQGKVQQTKADICSLRIENEKLKHQNLELEEALRRTCRNCDISSIEKDEMLNKSLKEKLENMDLKLKLANLKSVVALKNMEENPWGSLIGKDKELANPLKLKLENEEVKQEKRQLHHLANILRKPVEQVQSPSCSLDLQIGLPGQGISREFTMPSSSKNGEEMNKVLMIETAVRAMAELTILVENPEPFWVKSACGRYVIDRGSYSKNFSRLNHFGKFSWTESSKFGGVVATSGRDLIDIFMDSNKWAEMFPMVVTKARTIEVLDSRVLNDDAGTLQLIYEQSHILSPRVAPRDYYLLNFCQKIGQNKWIVVKVSYEYSTVAKDSSSLLSWRLPSGFIIEDKLNGYSEITWVEHVEADGHYPMDGLYRDILFGEGGFGAKRWVVTLQRMSERLRCFAGVTFNHSLGAIDMLHMKRSLMDLADRMAKNFAEMLSMSDDLLLKLHFHDGVDVSVRRNYEPGQGSGLILGIVSSVWLPLQHETVFNFIKDETTRAQWDVLLNEITGVEFGHISCGTPPENRISIMQTSTPETMLLQESCVDSLGSQIVYAPVEFPAIFGSSVRIKNFENLYLLPSGFVISDDDKPKSGSVFGASTSSAAAESGGRPGCILTVAIQVRACFASEELMFSTVEIVRRLQTLPSCIIEKIKIALCCSFLVQ